MEPRIARRSFGPGYECAHPWDPEIFVQCGDSGVVFTPSGSYRTAFFEAFPDGFIRGEGTTLAEAETAAWTQYQQHQACPGHEYERREYRNGAGFCKHCGKFKGKVFESLDRCVICDAEGYGNRDGEWLCKAHHEEKYPPKPPLTEEQFKEGLEAILGVFKKMPKEEE